MWSVFSVVAFLSIFESVFTHNQNETSQNQTVNDVAGPGASFARNLTASISVSDADLATKSSDFPREFYGDKVNVSDRVEVFEQAEKRENVVTFNIQKQTTNTTGEVKKLDSFRPSPQLETLYEFNKFPVKPAYPEAKIVAGFGSIASDDENSFKRGEVLPLEIEKSRNIDAFEPGFSAFGNSNSYQNFGSSKPGYSVGTTAGTIGNNRPPWTTKTEKTEDTPWVSRVRFPTGPTRNSISPYPYVANPTDQKPQCCDGNNGPNPQYAQSQNIVNNAQQTFQKNSAYLPPVDTRRPNAMATNEYLPAEANHNSNNNNDRPTSSTNNQRGGYLPPLPQFSSPERGNAESNNKFATSYESSGPSEGFNFNKLIEIPMKYFSGSQNTYSSNHKTYDTSYNLMEKPSYEHHGKTHGGGYGVSNPWKKILKLFATFIPIGLLISALTPTVITVTNVNDTNMQTTRYRSSDDPKKELQKQILSSLEYFDKLNENGCEYRVFCKLLVSASQMPDSERHVQNLLDNFAKQDIDYKSRADDLKRVFEAVRNQDCNPISCEFIKNPT